MVRNKQALVRIGLGLRVWAWVRVYLQNRMCKDSQEALTYRISEELRSEGSSSFSRKDARRDEGGGRDGRTQQHRAELS